ncbi:MAG: hypothetical protein ACC683_12025, partial [Acidimicrobiia bacterium]
PSSSWCEEASSDAPRDETVRRTCRSVSVFLWNCPSAGAGGSRPTDQVLEHASRFGLHALVDVLAGVDAAVTIGCEVPARVLALVPWAWMTARDEGRSA